MIAEDVSNVEAVRIAAGWPEWVGEEAWEADHRQPTMIFLVCTACRRVRLTLTSMSPICNGCTAGRQLTMMKRLGDEDQATLFAALRVGGAAAVIAIIESWR
jgi:hypothetical protein